MSASRVNCRDARSWIRDPADYPNFPLAKARRGGRSNPVALAHLDGWFEFLAGFRDEPPASNAVLNPEGAG